MKFYSKLILLTLICVGFANCSGDKDKEINKEPIISTFYLIRHAEKDRSDSTNIDPELTQQGLDRAIRWAEIFDKVSINAIYSTNYERTQMTAAPIAIKKNLDVQTYDPKNLDVEAFLMDNEGFNVLIVGHSNTTPDFANKLLKMEKYEAMDDTDNGSLFIVRVVDGKASDIRLNIN
ncbi:MAG: histidine phosphatase family protein [Croceitalea sp.]|nr:histidine phosphatase family protein [Croceitalea sp.]NNL07875.1 histidine phosphatase family protein [Croceitalea sp.]